MIDQSKKRPTLEQSRDGNGTVGEHSEVPLRRLKLILVFMGKTDAINIKD